MFPLCEDVEISLLVASNRKPFEESHGSPAAVQAKIAQRLHVICVQHVDSSQAAGGHGWTGGSGIRAHMAGAGDDAPQFGRHDRVTHAGREPDAVARTVLVDVDV